MTETPYQLFEELTDEEFAALKAHIAENGILVPVEVDETGAILDGHHRVRAWTELKAEGWDGPGYPCMVRSGLTETEKRVHVRTLNLLRRQVTRDQRKAHALAMRADGATLEATAAAAGVTAETVRAWTEDDSTFRNLKVEGKDGKARPARYTPRKSTTVFHPHQGDSPGALGFHPMTEIIPMMNAQEYAGLVESIRTNGQRVPITGDSKTNTIIDGRCRYRACMELGIEPRIKRREVDDPLGFIVSMNLCRKSLSADQIAMAAARLSAPDEKEPR